MFRENGFTGVPVVSGDSMVGILSRRDFMRVRGTSHLKAPGNAFTSNRVIHVSPKSGVSEGVRLIVRHDIDWLPVLENDRLLGLITRSDTMRSYTTT